MERYEQTGKTVEDALRAVEERIGRPLLPGEYRVKDVGSRGVLGLIGARPAVIEWWQGPSLPEAGEEPLTDWVRGCAQRLLEHLGLSGRATVSQQEECLQIDLEMGEEDGGILIGRRGATLEAFQHVLRRIVERRAGQPVSVVVDVGGYRQRRRDALVKRALRIAEQVKRSGRQVILDPMPPGDRRAVHMALKPDRDIMTYSVGEEPDRKVVIAPAEGTRGGGKKGPGRERPREKTAATPGRASVEMPQPEAPPAKVESAMQEITPEAAPLYGRRRVYRKPKNRPVRPMSEGL